MRIGGLQIAADYRRGRQLRRPPALPSKQIVLKRRQWLDENIVSVTAKFPSSSDADKKATV
ncbi:hypothetical protein GCM10007919_71640 [Rhizobium indigoferae]|nr:hypothetical protein GCM10007919_71640 [Rhizobium indigoferae]